MSGSSAKLGGVAEVALCLLVRRKRRGPLGRARQALGGSRLDRRGIVLVGRGAVCLQEVRSYDFDDFGVVAAPLRLEIARDGEVTRLSLPPGERVVRDLLHERVQELVLPSFGRERVGLQGQDLLADERCEPRPESRFVLAGDLSKPAEGERLAENRGVLEQASFGRFETVQAGSDQRVQGLRNLECLERSRDPVLTLLTRQHAAVEEHPDGLDGVERYALRPLADLGSGILG